MDVPFWKRNVCDWLKATNASSSHSSLPILTVTDSWKESHKSRRTSLHFIEVETKPLKIAL